MSQDRRTKYKSCETDVLVIGQGIAGLRAAYAAVQSGARVMVVSKCGNASIEVMGFNAVMDQNDSVESYYQDLVTSGAGICNPRLTRVLAQKAGEDAKELRELGLSYDTNADGSLNTMLTLGCSYPRLIHDGSYTGLKILKLLETQCVQKNVKFRNAVMITTLIKDGDHIVGAAGFDTVTEEFMVFWAKAVVLAAGGCGDMHTLSTYPGGIVGDGYAMAFEAGAQLVDMEFLQYEPCCFIYPNTIKGKLAVTTLLMEGGELRNSRGETFVKEQSQSGYHIQKNQLAQYILKEIADGKGSPHGGIYYDVTAVPEQRVKVDNAIFYRPALSAGVDLTKDYAEVVPVAHTCLGGVRIDTNCATSVPGLFAAGEVTGGIHGANRIGGCSGAETIVFGAIAGSSAAVYANEHGHCSNKKELADKEADRFARHAGQKEIGSRKDIMAQISRLIDEKIGMVRNKKDLQEALQQLDLYKTQLEEVCVGKAQNMVTLYQAKNIVTTAKIQAKASLLREESRGVFCRSDFPGQNDDEWCQSIIIERNGNECTTRKIRNQ